MLGSALAAVLLALASPVQAPAAAPPARAAEAYFQFLEGRRLGGDGRIDEAIAALRRAAELDPQSADVRAEMASLFARQNRAADATREAEAALRLDPANRQAHRILGGIHASAADARGGGPPEAATNAIAHFEAARPARGIDVGLEYALGRLYFRVEDYDKAIDALTRFQLEQPGVPEVILLLAEAHAAAGRSDAAVRVLEEALADDPAFYRGLLRLAELHEADRRWTEAADAYARAAALNPRGRELTNRRAAALLNAGNPESARDLLRPAATATPVDAGALYLFAQAARDAADLEAAEAAARRLMTADPRDVRGPYALALVLDRRQAYRQEVDTLEAAIARLAGGRPSAAALLQAQLASAYHSLGDQPKALATIERAIAATPDDDSLQFQRASLLERGGQFADAERAFRDLLARDPLNAGALNYLGYMLADRGERLDEAVSLIRRALAADPDNPSYLDSLGWAYFKLDRLDLAEPPLQQAAERLKTSSVVQDHLGDLRFRQRRYHEAIEAWTRALAGDGESIERAAIEKKIQDAQRLK